MIPLPEKTARKKRETEISRAMLVALNRIPGVRVSRNNNGKSPVPCTACKHKLCRGCSMRLAFPIVFGLGDGSPDLVGIITIGGHKSALRQYVKHRPRAYAFGVEVKQPGKTAERDQRAWHAVARARGMDVITATNTEEAVTFVLALIAGLDAEHEWMARRVG